MLLLPTTMGTHSGQRHRRRTDAALVPATAGPQVRIRARLTPIPSRRLPLSLLQCVLLSSVGEIVVAFAGSVV